MKQGNEYSDLIDSKFFEQCPKAVFAALAVSPIYNQAPDETTTGITDALRDEWQNLYKQGIVPQKPPKV